ncbi:shikimate dehydrogenase substrate binding domain-containing protein [Aspergillus cavernicola]|uniref:Shikimate dehydrogenase substrate binding domain-containing protein n=1 Tax=Aspergillus cavernicola TaxID=176166 RepID=A0ABR4IMQ5_9EURO
MEQITIPSDRDGVAYLYGHPLRNSLSPPLHQTVYNALGLNWTQIPLSSANGPSYTQSPDISTFLSSIRANPKFVGSSVTMPWKVAIMSHLDDLTEDARQAGACNTIFLRKDTNTAGNSEKKSYVGTNTDCIGIREALLQNSPTGSDHFRGKPALIVGGGGTARTAIYVLRRWLGASKIYVVNRDAAEVEAILAEDALRNPPSPALASLIPVSDPAVAATLEAPVAVVSGIPNYPPQSEEEKSAREVLQALLKRQTHEKDQGVILEMCYHPSPWTEIAQIASDARWKVILGSEALIWQGLEQAKLWTGTDVVAVPGLVAKVKEFVAQTVAERSKSNL